MHLGICLYFEPCDPTLTIEKNEISPKDTQKDPCPVNYAAYFLNGNTSGGASQGLHKTESSNLKIINGFGSNFLGSGAPR